MSDPQNFLVVDAYALLYRANFAFINRPLITKDGKNTSAIYGFMRQLMEALRLYRPGYLAVAFDLKGPTFRHELYPEYKAQRPPAPEAIVYGAEKLKELLGLLGIAAVSAQGFEADDVVGTLARQFASEASPMVMLSPDKDYQQLLGAHCLIAKPDRRGSGLVEVSEKDLLEKYGIARPEQFIDILALWGDTSDNVPGVPGIGEKTAAKLIAKYGDIERIRANLGNLPKKQGENIGTNSKQLELARQLVTIRMDAPVSAEIEDYIPKPVDLQGVKSLCEELEFRALGNDMLAYFAGEAGAAIRIETPERYATLATVPHEYTRVESPERFAQMMEQLENAPLFALDTETTGFSPFDDRLVSLQLCAKPGTGWFIPFDHEGKLPAEYHEGLARLLARRDKRVIGHNLKFDLNMLRAGGLEVRGELVDTMLLHYLLAPELPHGLDAVSMEQLQYRPMAYGELMPGVKPDDIDLHAVPPERLLEYAVEDADVCLRLYDRMYPRLREEGLEELYAELEGPLVEVLAEMEWNGVAIDRDELLDLRRELDHDREEKAAEIRRIAGDETLNVDSPRQIGAMLFDGLQLAEKARKTKTGQYNTSELELQKYAKAHPVVQTILDYREVKKLISTYVDALPTLVNANTKRIHAHFNQAVASTGRLSSSNPNLQNIPVRSAYGKRIRRAFVSGFEGGQLLSADYSQIELRLMADFSQDPNMVEAFRQGKDIHAATAARIFNLPLEEVSKAQREHAKRANFGMVYGISAYGLSQQLDIAVGEADRFIRGYFAMYPDVEKWMQEAIDQARERGYAATKWGRRRYLPDIHSGNANLRGAAERNAINAPIQGTAADIIKRAMVLIGQRLRREGFRSLLTTQVHDELIFDVAPGEMDRLLPLVRECMEGAIALRVPLVVDTAVGANWGDL